MKATGPAIYWSLTIEDALKEVSATQSGVLAELAKNVFFIA